MMLNTLAKKKYYLPNNYRTPQARKKIKVKWNLLTSRGGKNKNYQIKKKKFHRNKISTHKINLNPQKKHKIHFYYSNKIYI